MTAEILKGAALIFALDLPWLYTINGWANKIVTQIQGSRLEMKMWPAVPVYVALGYLLSVARSAQQAFLMGLATYVVYDFTLVTILKRYPLEFAVADSLWGGALMWMAWRLKEALHF